jgi:hypothetical protein
MRPVTGARSGRTTSPRGEMLLDQFAGTPEDELLDRLVAT